MFSLLYSSRFLVKVASLLLVTFTSSLLQLVLAQERDESVDEVRKVLPQSNNDYKYKTKNKHKPAAIKSPFLFNAPWSKDITFLSNNYQPYLEIGGIKYFNQNGSSAVVYDLFLPLIQNATQMIFADLRFFDRSGSVAEGNLHLGYRKLSPLESRMYGVYLAFDRKKSNLQNYFSQLTLGWEYWHQRWFGGGNIYLPVGNTKKPIKTQYTTIPVVGRNVRRVDTSFSEYYERVLMGGDWEIGYALNDNLTTYLGGYYFTSNDTKKVFGPRARLTWTCNHINLDSGVQYDSTRKITAYIGVKFKVNLGLLKEKNNNVTGFAKHMVELVRRDPDIITGVGHKVWKQSEFFPQANNQNFYGWQGLNQEEDFALLADAELLQEFDLSATASWQEIRKRYRQLVFQYHPDINLSDNNQFGRIVAIYKILQKRFLQKMFESFAEEEKIYPTVNVTQSSSTNSNLQVAVNGVNTVNKNVDTHIYTLRRLCGEDLTKRKLSPEIFVSPLQTLIAAQYNIDPVFVKCFRYTYHDPFWGKKIQALSSSILTKNIYSYLTGNISLNLPQLEAEVGYLFNINDILPLNLSKAIFKFYHLNQNYFARIVLDVLASDKTLPRSVLRLLLRPVAYMQDLATSLSIATYLAKWNLDLPLDKLQSTIDILYGDNSDLRNLALGLYTEITTPNLNSIAKSLKAALINLSSRIGRAEYNLIIPLGERLGLTLSVPNTPVLLAPHRIRQRIRESLVKANLWEGLSDDDQVSLCEGIKALQKLWPVEFLFERLQRTESFELTKIITILDKLKDYGISSILSNRYGTIALEILNNTRGLQLFDTINSLIRDQHFFTPRTIDELFADAINLGVTKEYFKEQLTQMIAIQTNDAGIRGIALRLQSWTQKEFTAWYNIYRKLGGANMTSFVRENIAEVMAVFSQAAYNTILKQHHPYPGQLLALVSDIHTVRGRFIQMSTSDGKTFVIAMVALIKVLERLPVDIITKDSGLAIRDVAETHDFYALFGVSVCHNIGQGKAGAAEDCCKNDIVYGDIAHFSGDRLWSITEVTKYDRWYGVVIMDEVDVMTVDQSVFREQLSRSTSSLMTLNQILVYLWGNAVVSGSQLHQGKEKCFLKIPKIKKQESFVAFFNASNENIKYHLESLPEITNCVAYLKEYLINYTQKHLFAFERSTEKRIFIPRYLRQFAREQLRDWVDSIFIAGHYREKVDYIVHTSPADGGKSTYANIVPIDKDSGVLRYRFHLQNGLQQFLLMKEGLVLVLKSIVSIFTSYCRYLANYRYIYGFSATLNPEQLTSYYQQLYGVEVTTIPSYIPKDLVWFAPTFVTSEELWIKAILHAIRRKVIANQRAGLVVLTSLAEVEKIAQALRNDVGDLAQVFTFGFGDNRDIEIAARHLKPRDIIIATIAIGRGTNLCLEKEVLKNLGLHVIMGFSPSNTRNYYQLLGRLGRRGEPGSVEMIVNVRHTKCKNQACFAQNRERDEKKLYNNILHQKIPHLNVADDLFIQYVKLLRNIDSPSGYDVIIGAHATNVSCQTLSAYLYLKNNDIMLKVINCQETKYLNVTESIAAIEPRELNALRTILSVTHRVTPILSKRSYELIQFILANQYCLQNVPAYRRVENALQKEMSFYAQRITANWQKIMFKFFSSGTEDTSLGQQKYCMYLLQRDDKFADLNGDEHGFNVSQLCNKVILRRKFFLWLEDRRLYNFDYEVMQLNEYWGVWLKRYYKERQQIHNISVFAWQLQQKFDAFQEKVISQKSSISFIKNLSYLVLKAWNYLRLYYHELGQYENLDQLKFLSPEKHPRQLLILALEMLDYAKKIGKSHGWAVHNALSYIALTKSVYELSDDDEELRNTQVIAIKQQFCSEATQSMENIEQVVIPEVEAQLSFLLTQKLIDYSDDLTIHWRGSIEVFRCFIKAQQKNLELVAGSLSKFNEMARIKKTMDFENMTRGINMTEVILRDVMSKGKTIYTGAREDLLTISKGIKFKSRELIVEQILASGGLMFELETYQLPKIEVVIEGYIFATLMGIACIGIGFMLPGIVSGIFTNFLSYGLVMQGLGDILMVGLRAANHKPLKIKEYINSKGMALGITIATAGILSFMGSLKITVGAIQAINQAVANLRAAPVFYLTNAALMQLGTMAISSGLYKLGEKLIDYTQIISEVRAIMSNIISVSFYRQLLTDIFAANYFNNENNINVPHDFLRSMLYDKIKQEIGDYLNGFNHDVTKFGTGTVEGVGSSILNGVTDTFGLGNMVQATTKIIRGAIKNSEATSKIGSDIKQSIVDVRKNVPSGQEMMTCKLQKDYGAIYGMNLSEKLFAQQNIFGENILSINCSVLQGLYLNGELHSYKQGVVDNCEYLQLIKNANYTGEYQGLGEYVTDLVAAVVKNIQQEEIVKVGSDAISSEILFQFNRFIKNKIEQQQELQHIRNFKRFQMQQRRSRFVVDLELKNSLKENVKNLNYFGKNIFDEAQNKALTISNKQEIISRNNPCDGVRGCYYGGAFIFESLMVDINPYLVPRTLTTRHYAYMKVDDATLINVEKLAFIVERNLNVARNPNVYKHAVKFYISFHEKSKPLLWTISPILLSINYLVESYLVHVGFMMPNIDGDLERNIFSYSYDSAVKFAYKGEQNKGLDIYRGPEDPYAAYRLRMTHGYYIGLDPNILFLAKCEADRIWHNPQNALARQSDTDRLAYGLEHLCHDYLHFVLFIYQQKRGIVYFIAPSRIRSNRRIP